MSNQDWLRLADYVISHRTARGFGRQPDLAEAAGVASKTVGRLERGESVNSATLAKIERALRWAPGSARSILAGGEPTLLEPMEPVDPAREALLRAHAVYVESYGLEEADRMLAKDVDEINAARARTRTLRSAERNDAG